MKKYHVSRHNRFITVGLNYEKADVETRGRFALLPEAEAALLDQARAEGVDGLLVTSTCNRTELHGFAESPEHLIRLLCQHSNGTEAEFQRVGYVHINQKAISHLFRVGCGLDSQILGDFEIISQLKKAFYQSRDKDLTNPFLERLTNAVIQASKRIKNETGLSSGATSVAFASVQYLLARVPAIAEKRILLYGTGKIGRNTCQNLVKHTGHQQITLINRTLERAEALASKLKLEVRPVDQLADAVREADVIVVATGAPTPTLLDTHIPADKPRWVLDLSIPANVAPAVGELAQTTLVNLDQLSRVTDQTLRQREQYIPQAEAIIGEIHADFTQWLESRRYAPVLRALKRKLQTMKEEELDFQSRKIADFDKEQTDVVTDRIISKITRQFANHLKDSDIDTEEYLDLISRIFQLETDAL